MKTYVLAAALMAASFTAWAGNDHSNPCGNNGNNCNPSGDVTTNGGNGYGGDGYGGAGGDAHSIGLGVGLGLGGQGGDGGSANAVGTGGAVLGSGNSSNVNNNKAEGGTGIGLGGSANQGQAQGQSQSAMSGAVSGSKSVAQTASENSLKNTVNASSANDNRSSAAGNTTVTNVGGDSTLVERNAPPVFLGNLTATMSCAGGFNAGASDRNGSGAFGLTWISADCRSVVMGREFVGIGMPDVACRIWKTTKGYKRAVKADPSLADVDCTVKPAVVVPAAVIPQAFLEARTPRG